MSRSWDEIVAERKGITLEEQIAEREAYENAWQQEKRIENIQETLTGIIIPSLVAVLLFVVIIKIVKNDFTKINFPKIKKQEKEFENIEIIDKAFSMRWFDLLVKFLMPFWLFISPLTLFGNLHLNIKEYYGSWKYYLTNPVDGIPNTLSLMLSLLVLIFLFITWRESKKLTTKGYKYIMIFFVLVIMIPTITTLIYLPFYLKAGVSIEFYNAIGRTIPPLVMGIPSLIYFKKRKEVFGEHNLRRDSLGEQTKN